MTAPQASETPRVAPRYVIRAAAPSHHDFVANTWFEMYRDSAYELRRVRPGPLQRRVGIYIDTILKRAEVVVATPPDDDAVLYGFRVSEPRTVHFVYVRKPLRQLGIGRELVKGLDLEGMAWSTPTAALRNWIGHKVRLGPHVPFWMEDERYA